MSNIGFFTLLFIFYFLPMIVTLGFIFLNRKSKNVKGLYFIFGVSLVPIVNIWGAYCALGAVSE